MSIVAGRGTMGQGRFARIGGLKAIHGGAIDVTRMGG